ncbi:scavenger receptor class F member 1-like [Mercenaria mercenaria]|uniref:scavenger receptor class F member 1-like n=1 Tax=Mercenaria mercenaria TaxID=6596 RepID=UPI00234E68CB|nr:scavenger receptor class F member 1-like [Mercenaria mercenaria]
MFTVLKFLLCISCPYVADCYNCKDISFSMEDFHLCPKHCVECSLHNACMLCKGNASGSSCRSKCKIGCVVSYIPHGTLLRGCYAENVGDECCMFCPPYSSCSNCSQFYGPCLKCSKEFYGRLTHCDKKCGNCRPDKEGEVECDIDTGSCPGDCMDGYYGTRCDKKCNKNCLDHETKTRRCDRHTGDCVFGCIAGRYNYTCEGTCSNTCFNRSCDKQSGTCNAGCISGWYGDICEKNCSETCANKSCNQYTGHCMNGCIPGRHGDKCEEICRSTCNNNTCNQLSGHCDNGCLYGFHGPKCEASCSNLCLNRTCNQTSGHCENGCVPGSYGNLCEMTCSSTCLKNTCNQISGHCKFGCVNGWFGNTCGDPCSETCFNKSCDNFSGFCEKGCILEYYGEKCEKNCSEAHVLRICDNSTARCPGCEPGFFGDPWTQNSTNDHDSTDTIITYSTVGVVSALACTFTVGFIRRSILYRKRNFQTSIELPALHTSEPFYEEIDDTNDSATSQPLYIEFDSDSTHLHKSSSNLSVTSNVPGERAGMIAADIMIAVDATNSELSGTQSLNNYEMNQEINSHLNQSNSIIEISSVTYSSTDNIRNIGPLSRTQQDCSDLSKSYVRTFECLGIKLKSSVLNGHEDNAFHSSENPVESVGENRDSAFYIHPCT